MGYLKEFYIKENSGLRTLSTACNTYGSKNKYMHSSQSGDLRVRRKYRGGTWAGC